MSNGTNGILIERNACTVCGGEQLKTIYRSLYASPKIRNHFLGYYGLAKRGLAEEYDQNLQEAEFILQECAMCNAITQRYAPSEALAEILYGKWIDEDPGRAKKRKPGFEEYTHAVQEALILTSFLLRHRNKSVPSDLRVLDFGVGWGRFAQAMKACGCDIYAFDLSEERRSAAERNGMKVVSRDEIAGLELDFINTEQVFEHLSEPLVTARELARGLGPGGVLKISVPFARWMEKTNHQLEFDWSSGAGSKEPGLGRGSPAPIFPLEHLTYFKRPSIEVMARKAGLHRVKLSALDELNFAFDWRSARAAARNLLRPWIRDHVRNYQLFARESA